MVGVPALDGIVGHGSDNPDFHRRSCRPPGRSGLRSRRLSLHARRCGLGRTRVRGRAHTRRALRASRPRSLGSQDRNERPSPAAGFERAPGDAEPSRHRKWRAGRGVRSGQRHVREPALVAAALDGARRRGRARRRVQEVERRRTRDDERTGNARATRIRPVTPFTHGRRRRPRLVSLRKLRTGDSSMRGRPNAIVEKSSHSTERPDTFQAR